MRVCEHCRERGGTEHITVIVDAFGAAVTERMYAQFWLCAVCLDAVRQLFVRDDNLKRRVAAALRRS